MAVVSIDLASRRYDDIGIAVLDGRPGAIRVDLVAPGSRGLGGTPEAPALARVATGLASESRSNLILLDGPQGWRASASQIDHMRVCERCTHTPGKTGFPGVVKPASWTRMARFSIEVFDELHTAGWERFSGQWPVARAAVESFPTHAWRSLGRPAVPGKSRRETQLDDWIQYLSRTFGILWPRLPSHDELQAVVAGLAGIALQYGHVSDCVDHGIEPFIESGTWREGFILSPRQPTHMRLHPKPAVGPRAHVACPCGRHG